MKSDRFEIGEFGGTLIRTSRGGVGRYLAITGRHSHPMGCLRIWQPIVWESDQDAVTGKNREGNKRKKIFPWIKQVCGRLGLRRKVTHAAPWWIVTAEPIKGLQTTAAAAVPTGKRGISGRHGGGIKKSGMKCHCAQEIRTFIKQSLIFLERVQLLFWKKPRCVSIFHCLLLPCLFHNSQIFILYWHKVFALMHMDN